MFVLQSEKIIFTKISFRLMEECIEPPPSGTKLTVKPELTDLFYVHNSGKSGQNKL